MILSLNFIRMNAGCLKAPALNSFKNEAISLPNDWAV